MKLGQIQINSVNDDSAASYKDGCFSYRREINTESQINIRAFSIALFTNCWRGIIKNWTGLMALTHVNQVIVQFL